MHIWAVLAGAISQLMSLFLFEPRYEKAGFFCICENKTQISFAVTTKLIGGLVLDIRIVQFLFYLNTKISSLRPSSVAVQPGLGQTWSETPKTGFIRTRLIYSYFSVL